MKLVTKSSPLGAILQVSLRLDISEIRELWHDLAKAEDTLSPIGERVWRCLDGVIERNNRVLLRDVPRQDTLPIPEE